MADQTDSAAVLADGLRWSDPKDVGNVLVNKNPREPSATLKRLMIGRLQITFPELSRSKLASGNDDFGQDRFRTFGGHEALSLSVRTTTTKGKRDAWTNTSQAQFDEYSRDNVVLLMLLWMREFVWAFCIPPGLPGLRDAVHAGSDPVLLTVGPNSSGQITVNVGIHELPLHER